ncbi:unnamed protein product [Didymodactylos carnosus]|uniref:Uncharacterized protein n=1 Tax=Didymodactylos carnosus TaxID=1234261 RepID=A0A815ILH3_9BILA|nr:unnamed protein product [Didymodactylos carnosus]CAF1370040.1 unnamed protein product [Didymodactylos carnosus]CAF4018445.1 unnamed protein product [Didymodactylos carnosus]CAF4255611.1 unnamed protein product [Didymodactylos carnosus]
MGRFRFFLIVFIVQFVYYWIPGYFMPILTSFSIICFINDNNIVLGQLTGFYGLGIGALQLDWQSVTAFLQSPILYPWWALLNVLVGFIGIYWIIVPILYYTHADAKLLPIFSGDSYAKDGTLYNYSLITDDGVRLNQTAYEQYGDAVLTPTFEVTFCIQVAVITAIIVHVILYHGKFILKQFNMSVYEATNDVHGSLMAKLAKEVPEYWYTLLFLSLFVCSAIVCELAALMPWYYLFVIISIDFVLLLPSGIIKAITNQDIDLDLLMSLLGGLVLKGNAVANMTFRTYGYTAQRRSLTFIGCLKLGHYMKIPPRVMFTMLVVSTLIGSTMSYVAAYIIINYFKGLCSNNNWLCPKVRVFKEISHYLGTIGTANFLHAHSVTPYFFLVGALCPIPAWLLHKRFPKVRWLKYVHFPVMLASLSQIPPIHTATYPTWIFIGFIFNYVIQKRAPDWWNKYAYIFSAAMSAGVGAALIFVAFLPAFPVHWWGNAQNEVEGDGCKYSTANYYGVEPSIPRPRMEILEDKFELYLDYHLITQTASSETALALLLSLYNIFEIRFTHNNRCAHTLYGIIFADGNELGKGLRTILASWDYRIKNRSTIQRTIPTTTTNNGRVYTQIVPSIKPATSTITDSHTNSFEDDDDDLIQSSGITTIQLQKQFSEATAMRTEQLKPDDTILKSTLAVATSVRKENEPHTKSSLTIEAVVYSSSTTENQKEESERPLSSATVSSEQVELQQKQMLRAVCLTDITNIGVNTRKRPKRSTRLQVKRVRRR